MGTEPDVSEVPRPPDGWRLFVRPTERHHATWREQAHMRFQPWYMQPEGPPHIDEEAHRELGGPSHAGRSDFSPADALGGGRHGPVLLSLRVRSPTARSRMGHLSGSGPSPEQGCATTEPRGSARS